MDGRTDVGLRLAAGKGERGKKEGDVLIIRQCVEAGEEGMHACKKYITKS